MTADQVIGFVLVLLAMLVGLAGAIIPGLPGTPLVFAAALGHRLWFVDKSVSWWVVAVLGILMLFSLAVDFLATSVGAKGLGATWRGMVGAVIGAMIGLFFAPLGLILGPFLGAMLLEAIGGRDWRQASKAGAGAALGFLAGTVGRIACCVAMIGLFVLNLLSHWTAPTP
jgi:uncharacterized protein YqgC (DUF456 family)